MAATLHFPFTHPHLPAPQSIGPSQLSVQNTLQTSLSDLLMQLVGWQHSAGTQSSSVTQSWSGEGGVVIAVVGGRGVGVGDRVPGGAGEVHPLTRTRPAARSRTMTNPE